MIRRVVSVILLLFAASGGAAAQTCSGLTTLTNGTNADATQVMANFNALVNCVNNLAASVAAPRGYLSGLTLSTPGSSSGFGIAQGVATSDDATTSMPLTTSPSKTTAAWAAGSGNGSLDAGTIANNTWYHVFLIERTDTNVVDVLISQSAMSPTLPTSYNKKRRIGAMKTNGSAQWIAFTQIGDYFQWATPIGDASALTVGTTPVAITLSVPPGVNVEAKFNGEIGNTNASGGLLFYSPVSNTQAANSPGGNLSLFSVPAVNAMFGGPMIVLTNTSGQTMAVTNNTGNTASVATIGWWDGRGKLN